MASLLKVDALTGVTTAGSISVTGEGNSTTTNLQQGLCKGWALTDFAAAQNDDSFNVSAYTDYGAGYGQLSWNNDFNNANYAVAQACSGSSTNPNAIPGSQANSSKGTGTIRIVAMDSSNATPSSDNIDYTEFGTVAMGDLA
tara:strand:- start:583 stop:1008 length:426 start_codon:yes stop_codon:yes gene_type:complete